MPVFVSIVSQEQEYFSSVLVEWRLFQVKDYYQKKKKKKVIGLLLECWVHFLDEIYCT